MKISYRAFGKWLLRNMRMHFLAGLLLMIPLGATVLILVWIFESIDNILQPYIIIPILGHPIRGVGFGIAIILIYLAGIVASNVFGRKLIQYGESLLAKVPLVRPLYGGIKQIVESFSRPRQGGFMQVVLIEFPRKDIWTLGFVTNESHAQSGETHLNIFIPTSPNPTSGFLQIVNEKEVIRTKISVEQALRMIVSVGRVLPDSLTSELAKKTG